MQRPGLKHQLLILQQINFLTKCLVLLTKNGYRKVIQVLTFQVLALQQKGQITWSPQLLKPNIH